MSKRYSIDDDIPELLELEDDEKLVHTLHRTYLSVAMTIIFGALFIFGYLMITIYGQMFQIILDFAYYAPLFLGAPFIVLVICIVIGILIGKWYAGGHLFLITTKRILFYKKFVTKNLRELRFNKITDTLFNQGPIGRIFDYANITLSTPGMEGGMGLQGIATFLFSIKGIHDGLKIRQDIANLMNAALVEE